MKRVLVISMIALLALSSASLASRTDHCDEKYKFGSSEWWVCEQGSRGSP